MTSPAEPADTELVARVLAGDRAAFAAIYDRYSDRLHDFCVSILRDRDDAADAVQDTFLLAAERLSQLRDPQRLRPWLYAVARSVALRRLRDRKRYAPGVEVVEQPDPGPLPQRAAEQAALRELVWSAAAGLSDRDRALLDLHLRHGLDGAELGEAMGVSAGHASVLLTRLRDQLERSLGALLVARLGRRDCPELAALLKTWDGRLSPLMRKRVARHVDRCDGCGERRRRTVSPVALLATVPLIPAPALLRERVLHRVQLVAHQAPADPPGSGPTRPPDSGAAGPPNSGAGEPPGRRRRRLLATGAVLMVITGVGAGLWAGTWNRTSPELAGTAGPGHASTAAVPPSAASSSMRVPPASASGAARPPGTGPGGGTSPTDPASGPGDIARPVPPPGAAAPPTATTGARSRTGPSDTTGPIIVRQDAAPGRVGERGCADDRATVYAEVSDPSGVDSVTLTWTDPGGRNASTELALRAGTWRGTLGPFTRLGRVRWQLVTTDSVGNTTTGSPAFLTVVSCTTPAPARAGGS